MKNKIRNKVYNIIFVVFVIVLLFFLFSRQTIETFINSTPNGDNTTPDVKFPFKNIYDDKDRKLPIICIGAPFRNDSHKKQYEEYKKKGFQFLCPKLCFK